MKKLVIPFLLAKNSVLLKPFKYKKAPEFLQGLQLAVSINLVATVIT